MAFGTLVAPLTADARAKLILLDQRLKGRLPPCLPKSLEGAAPEALPWIAVSTPTPVGRGAGGASRGGRGGAAKKSPKPRVKTTGKRAANFDPAGGGAGVGGAHGGEGGGSEGGGDGSGVWGGGTDGGGWGEYGGGHDGMWDGGASSGDKRPRKGNAAGKWGPDDSSRQDMGAAGGGEGAYSPYHSEQGMRVGGFPMERGNANGSPPQGRLGMPMSMQMPMPMPMPLGPGGNPRPAPLPPVMDRMPMPMPMVLGPGGNPRPAPVAYGNDRMSVPMSMSMPMLVGPGGASRPAPVAHANDSSDGAPVLPTLPPPPGGSKKRKAGDNGGASGGSLSNKRPKPPSSFSYAGFAGGLDGSETRGVKGAEFVGAAFRRGRTDGLLLYYVDKAPRDYPFEYESKAAGAASLDWTFMRKDLKVDAFCMETFRWYGAKVAEVSVERKQVKVRRIQSFFQHISIRGVCWNRSYE